MHDIVDLERRGRPSVLVASVEFAHAARAQSDALGATVACVLVPHPIQDRTDDEMVAMADAALDALVEALIAPVRAEAQGRT